MLNDFVHKGGGLRSHSTHVKLQQFPKTWHVPGLGAKPSTTQILKYALVNKGKVEQAYCSFNAIKPLARFSRFLSLVTSLVTKTQQGRQLRSSRRLAFSRLRMENIWPIYVSENGYTWQLPVDIRKKRILSQRYLRASWRPPADQLHHQQDQSATSCKAESSSPGRYNQSHTYLIIAIWSVGMLQCYSRFGIVVLHQLPVIRILVINHQLPITPVPTIIP